MRTIGAITRRVTALAPVVVSWLWLSTAAAQAEGCGLTLVAALPMQDNPHGRIVVPIVIRHTPLMMLVDTDGYVSMLTTETAAQLGLPTHQLNGTVYGLGDKITSFTKSSAVEIGPLHDVTMDFLLSRTYPDWKAANIAGTLAPEMLSRFDVDFDFAAKKMNLMLQDHCPGQVVYWASAYSEIPFEIFQRSHIRVPITLDGKAFTAEVDTGADVSVLSAGAAGREFGLHAGSPGIERLPSGEAGARLHTLTFGGVTVQNPLLAVVDDTIHQQALLDSTITDMIDVHMPQLPDVILGNDILRQLHLYIAYKERKIYLTAAGAH